MNAIHHPLVPSAHLIAWFAWMLCAIITPSPLWATPTTKPTTTAKKATTTKPTTTAKKVPTTKPITTAQKASTTKPMSFVASRPSDNKQRPSVMPRRIIDTNKRPLVLLPTASPRHRAPHAPQRIPAEMGVFSFALPQRYEGWIDGLSVGRLPVTYLRVAAGSHVIEVAPVRKAGEVQASRARFPISLSAGQHLVIGDRRGQFGFRFQRDEEHRVFLRIYQQGKPPVQQTRAPGPYCPPRSPCLFLAPGEHLYLRDNAPPLLQPPTVAERSVRSFGEQRGDGFLTLHSFPPGILLLNGRVYAPTPVARLPLRPGRYQAMILNGYVGMRWQKEIAILPSKETREIAILAPPQGGALRILATPPARLFVGDLYRGWTPYFGGFSSGMHTISLYRPHLPAIHKTLIVQPHSDKTLAY